MTADGPLALVAEDDPLASMALRSQLEALGYRVIGPAQTGKEAVGLGRCYPVEVALFDHRMPELSGLQAASALFEAEPTPVVLLTGVGTSDLPDPVPLPPVFELLTKPVDLSELAAGLEAARDRFRRWTEQYDRTDVADSRARRATIGRAVDRIDPELRRGTAAARFLDRATDEGRSPLELARALLDAGPP